MNAGAREKERLLMRSPALSFQIGLLTNNRERKTRRKPRDLLGENEDFGDKFVVGHSFEFFYSTYSRCESHSGH
jgi:hypothetical protein